jgi:anti-sigma factor RsiW
MTDRELAVTQDDLHAYVDGALDPAARAKIEAYLQSHPEEAGTVAAYERQNEALRALGASLEQAVDGSPFWLRQGAKQRHWAQRLLWVASVAALLLLAAGSGWWARGVIGPQPEQSELYQLAAVAYRLYTVQQRHPVEVWANERDHLQKWLGVSLNAPFVAPELNQQGYDLVGGRLLSNASGPAALLVYQRADSRRIVLYVCQPPGKGQGKAAFEAVGDLGTFTWKFGPLWYSLAGNLDADGLKRLAQVVNQQAITGQILSPESLARHH